MKFIFFALLFSSICLFSCKPEQADTPASTPLETPSLKNYDQADKNFIGFFENFMFDEVFQRNRINFPIRVSKTIEDEKDSYDISALQLKDWKHEAFFAGNQFIPILRPDTTKYSEKDVQTTKVELCMYDYDQQFNNNYEFYKNRTGMWELRNIYQISGKQIRDYAFLDFIQAFSSDSLYQLDHVKFPFIECSVDPDKDYEVFCDTLTQENWKHLDFKKSIKPLFILNQERTHSSYRNLYFRGVENGINMSYHFKKISGQWKLIYSEDIST